MRGFRNPLVGLLLVSLLAALDFSGAANADDTAEEFVYSDGAQSALDATAEAPVSKDAKQAAQHSLVSSDIHYGWEASPADGVSIYWSQVPLKGL